MRNKAISALLPGFKSKVHSSLQALVHDARHFILNSGSIIEELPLQAYCPALIFSPKTSIIETSFGIRSQSGLNVLHMSRMIGTHLCTRSRAIRLGSVPWHSRRTASASDGDKKWNITFSIWKLTPARSWAPPSACVLSVAAKAPSKLVRMVNYWKLRNCLYGRCESDVHRS